MSIEEDGDDSGLAGRIAGLSGVLTGLLRLSTAGIGVVGFKLMLVLMSTVTSLEVASENPFVSSP